MGDVSRAAFGVEARGARPDLARLCLLMGFEEGPGGLEDPADPEDLDHRLLPSWQAMERLAQLTAVAFEQAGHGRRAPGGPLGESASPAEQAALLAGALAGRADLRGGPGVYGRLESSLLHQVLRRGRGLPIMVCTVWITVGRMTGLPVYGVALPGHFVVGVGDPDGEHVLADPFHGGQPLTLSDAAALAGRPEQSLSPELLRPAEPLDMVLRILANIRAWAATRPEQARVQLWAAELALLLPRHPAHLRLERAEILVRTGDFLAGADEMESFAQILDAYDPDAATRVRLEAKAARHRLN
jgi:regulator of sirC expression with transglutaminase-like and TPR domain